MSNEHWTKIEQLVSSADTTPSLLLPLFPLTCSFHLSVFLLPWVLLRPTLDTARMILYQVLAMVALWTAGHEAVELRQHYISITKELTKTAHVGCQVSGSGSCWRGYIYWYQQKPNQPLQHLLSVQSTAYQPKKALGNIEDKFMGVKNDDRNAKLIIKEITLEDAATYYCACWETRGAKVFGGGTKLIVTSSNIPKKPPNPIFFLPTSEEINSKKSGTYICLLEDFFPGVIKTYWKENDNSHPLDAQVGPVTRVNNLYSQISWVTVSEDTLKKNLSYFYQHEGFDAGQGAKEIPVPSIAKETIKNNCENTEAKTKVFQEMHFANMSAFYTYSILLVKSTIYFAIILFFLYQKKATGSQGKK